MPTFRVQQEELRTLMDAYSRLVLSAIALCLLALVLGQAGVLPGLRGSNAPDVGDGAVDADRYSLTPIRVPPKSVYLLRMDKQTGRTWRIKFPATAGGWDLILEEEEAAEARRAAREAKAARNPASPDASEPR